MIRLTTIFIFITIVTFNYATDTPIIGILSQETYSVRKYFNAYEDTDSFIAGSYVKFLESAGARVIPVWIGQSEDYYKRVVEYTNGLLFPGGGTYFNETHGYGEAAKILFGLAKKRNDNGIHYPIWGTCLGMQVFIYASLGEDGRVDCDLHKVAIPLILEDDYDKSRILSKAPSDIIEMLKTKNVTYNYHKYCITTSVLKEHNISDDWRVVAQNNDVNDFKFISLMEGVKYPFYGAQFHPEKNLFEFRKNTGIPHTVEAVQTSQYFANFFVGECRKNDQEFPDTTIEKNALIYNYVPIYTGKNNAAYEQIYQFSKEDYEQNQLK